MPELVSFRISGSGSANAAGQAGKQHWITTVYGWFPTTGPTTGTLRMKEGGTTVWEAAVSGALEFAFPGYWKAAIGSSVTLELTGGQVLLVGGTVTV